MTFEDTTGYDVYNLSDLDDLSCNFSDQTESGLCVPLDPIESLSWLPTFPNNPISFHDLDLPKHDNLLFDDVGFFSSSQSNEIKKRPSLEDLWPCADLGFAKKKQRTKRSSKQRRFLPSFVEESGLVGDGDEDGDGDGDGARQRRCSHCQTDKTPQWRIGPLGPKTLCNACGVRYKSGRLVPEYRPAASPTFDNFKHSNFHKKIAKIRRGSRASVI